MSTFTADNSIDNKALLDYYWSYFELHSNQRMQMVNFYITIEVVLIGGLFALLQLKTPILWAECVACAGIALFSLTFWGLDMRTKQLIHACENAIKELEDTFPQGTEARLFKRSDFTTMGKTNTKTYSFWFNLQYGVIGGFGAVCLVLVLMGRI